MKTSRLFVASLLATLQIGALGAFGTACSPTGETVDEIGQGADAPLPRRHGTALADGCALDAWQEAQLDRPGTRRILQEIVLLCLVPRAAGGVGPADEAARRSLAEQIGRIRARGYKVRLGVAFTDETGVRYDGPQTAALLGDPTWRGVTVQALRGFAAMADGIDLDIQNVPTSARSSLTTFVTQVGAALRPATNVALWIPPSVTIPSDLPNGDAFEVLLLARHVDRLRVGTLDFSCCGGGPGPTIDPGWAVDAVRLARGQAGAVQIDVALPLYGTDFGPLGQRYVTHLEAEGLAARHRVSVVRDPLSPHFGYRDEGGLAHQLWFDDAQSLSQILRAWSGKVLGPEVGVVFYSFGAEDPRTFEVIAGQTP